MHPNLLILRTKNDGVQHGMVYTSCVFLPAGLREAQAAGIKLTQRPKIRFSPHRGDSLHRFT